MIPNVAINCQSKFAANIVPIFKKGDRTDRANYHRDTLTSVSCKITESIIKEKLTKFLDSHQLLCKEQHGLCCGRSCLTNCKGVIFSWYNLATFYQ